MGLFDKFRKKRTTTRPMGWEIYPASKRAMEWDEIHFKGRDLKFGKLGRGSKGFFTRDRGLAKEIEDYMGYRNGEGDVIVCEVDNPGTVAPRKSFIINAPWKKDN